MNHRVLLIALCVCVLGLMAWPAAAAEQQLEDGTIVESGEGQAPSLPDDRYGHGCTVICNYPKGPCGWARSKGNKPTMQLCSIAKRYASRVCRAHNKTPVTNCYIYKSW